MSKHNFIISLQLALLFAVTNAFAQNWTSMNGPYIPKTNKDIVASSSDGTQYVCSSNDILLISTSSGNVWRGTGSGISSPLVVTCDPDNPCNVIVSGTNFFYWSTDCGENWHTDYTPTTTNLSPLRLVTALYDDITQAYPMYFGRNYDNSTKSVWKSTDGGQSWNSSTNFTYSTDVYDFSPYPIYTPSRYDDVYACGSASTGSDKGLWFSADGGATWSSVSGTNTYNLRSVAVMHKTGTPYLFVVASTGEVRKSTNGGTSWSTSLSSGKTVRSVRINSYNSINYLFLATNEGIYRSTNEGSSWSLKNSGIGSDVDILSIAIVNASNTLYAGTATTVYKSTDNGDSWTDIGIMNVASVAANEDDGYIWAVSKDNPYVSYYSNSVWTNGYLGSFSSDIKSEFLYHNPNNSYLFVSGAADDSPVLYMSTNSGPNWYSVFSFSSTGNKLLGTVANPLVSSYMYAYGGGTYSGSWKNIFSSTNDGATWAPIGTNVGGGSNTVNDLKTLAVSTAVWMYAAVDNGKVYRDKNSGSSFNEEILDMGTGKVATGIVFNPDVAYSNTVYASGSDGIWKSTNSGDSWPSHYLSGNNCTRIIMNPTYDDANHLIAITDGGNKVYQTRNGGSSWIEITANIPTPVNDIKGDETDHSLVFAATAKGVHKVDLAPEPPAVDEFQSPSSNHPQITWHQSKESDYNKYYVYRYKVDCSWNDNQQKWECGSGYDLTLVATITTKTDTQYVDNSFTVVSSCMEAPNRGKKDVVYYVKAEDIRANVSDVSSTIAYTYQCTNNGGGDKNAFVHNGEEKTLPDRFTMESNFPNPFNPTTTIRFGIPEATHVSLKVYDVLGNEVASLVNEYREANWYNAEFDASNIPSGMYFYRLTAGKFTEIKKMVLMK